MALVIKKYMAPGNVMVGVLGTDNNDVPSHREKRHIVEIWLRIDVYNALDAPAKGHIDLANVANTINAAFGKMAVTTAIKKDAGGGWYEIQGNSTDVGSNYKGKTDCFRMRVNKPAYNALSANGKLDVDDAGSSTLISAPFN